MGIGASAGGLDALELFLSHVPRNSGLAFVVVQHLDPTRAGMLPEILQHSTEMKVAQAVDRMPVRANCVYVIPSNHDLSIAGGQLRLVEPTVPRGLRLPIDRFFRALAADQGSRSVGVVLSGMGSDGTLGLKEIKAHGGLGLVQDPSTAQFDAMPRSALDTGLADAVAPAEELPAKLSTLLRLPPHPEERSSGHVEGALAKVTALLHAATGHDFSQYKKSTLRRRVERRMALHQLTSLSSYLRLLQENAHEQTLLFDEFLIGVTSFFRDAPAWDALRDEVLPELLRRHPNGGQLRAWVVGCSTGEEAYSLGIVFREALEKVKPRGRFTLQIFATDLQQRAIDVARQALYPADITKDVSPERLRRFFSLEGDGRYRVRKEVREMVILAQQDVLRDPPFTRLDVLTCRNLLIYLDAELQSRLLPLFHHSLGAGGVLFLGNSETVGSVGEELFAPIEGKLRIYRRRASARRLNPLKFPSSYVMPREAEAAAPLPNASFATLAEQAILRQFGPPAVLITEQGDVLFFSGHTGAFLEPSAGKTNWNVFAMAREGLRLALLSAVRNAVRKQTQVTVTGVKLGERTVELTVQPLTEPVALRGMLLVVFTDLGRGKEKASTHPARSGARPKVAELELRLAQTTEELRETREEMQASNEELKSSNEELQSTNEELQSTNEELTTSKEELQSTNEELQTVNAELNAKLEELSRANSDMKNLLNASDIATVFLDRDLKIRRFTAQATRLIKLIASDVGRPVTDLSSRLLYPALAADVEEVLRTLIFQERQVTTAEGRWFTVRVMPYRTADDVIDGVVITMIDITEAKLLEAELRTNKERFGRLLESLPPSAALLDAAGKVVPRSEALDRIVEAAPKDFAAWRIVIAP